MGFYPPDSLVHDAQRRGIEVRPPCVNRSEVECSVEVAGTAGRWPLAVRVGIGYVTGLREAEAKALVDERERNGSYADLADLASRGGVGPDGLERLAWSGACDALGEGRREALWRLGIARAGAGEPVQLSLPLDLPAAPSLRELSPWDRLLADYASTGLALREHPMELLRPSLRPAVLRAGELPTTEHGGRVEVAGLVVARQRPSTANGVVFMLLEDETGSVNVVVPPPVYRRDRLTVRSASFAVVAGRLERREGVINVVASGVEPLARPDLPLADVRHIEPTSSRETGRDGGTMELADAEAMELAAVAPRAHSFGRRG
jgi:error-prone DNA polymerase